MNAPSFIPSIPSALKYLASTSYLKSILKIIFNNLNQCTKIVYDNVIKRGSTWVQISRFVHLYSVGLGLILIDFYCFKSTLFSTLFTGNFLVLTIVLKHINKHLPTNNGTNFINFCVFYSAGGASEQKLCKGINYLKEGSDPPLLPDSEYPEWLWNILDDDKKLSVGDQSFDINNITHRRRQRKAKRRQENAMRKQNK